MEDVQSVTLSCAGDLMISLQVRCQSTGFLTLFAAVIKHHSRVAVWMEIGLMSSGFQHEVSNFRNVLCIRIATVSVSSQLLVLLFGISTLLRSVSQSLKHITRERDALAGCRLPSTIHIGHRTSYGDKATLSSLTEVGFHS